MEFGLPALYEDLAIEQQDFTKSLLETLGPFHRALNEITEYGEKNREVDDKIETG